MSKTILLSRSAALCGGSLPLELLARKLDRFGEAEALQAVGHKFDSCRAHQKIQPLREIL